MSHGHTNSNVFIHGQLYVAFLRATSKKGVIVQLNKEHVMVSRNNLKNKNFTFTVPNKFPKTLDN